MFVLLITVALFVHKQTAYAEDSVGCQQEFPYEHDALTDSTFANYESVEYQNGYLVIHIKTTERTGDIGGIRWFPNLILIDDLCRVYQLSYTGDLFGIGNDVRNVSFRFDSPVHYQIYNDDTNQPLTCGDCSKTLVPAFPYFFKVRLHNKASYFGVITGETTSSTHHIQEHPGSVPVRIDTLPRENGCQPMSTQNDMLDIYEHAEYVDGLLRVHFRANPFRLGLGYDFNFRLNLHDQNCIKRNNVYGKTIFFPWITEYFSVRFTSPTHFILWNDDLDKKIVCWNFCEGDLSTTQVPSGAPASYLSIEGTSNLPDDHGFAQPASFLSTPFPIEEPPPPPSGNSSVIFLPGLEASRLYEQGTLFENQLWDPNRNQDIQDLYLDENGNSIRPYIYTRDLVDTIDLSSQNIYKSFINTMNGLVADDTIADWQPFVYDWRFDLSNVVLGANMIDRLQQMAAASDSGRVTIVAHSNGGLVAKELISQLEERGKADLVDKLILVAVPQMGTPKAIEALLHGEDVGFLKGLFVPRWITRGLAEHAPGVFNLLPTESYFAKVIDPVIEFDPNATSTANLRAAYGNAITTAAGMRNFLKGLDGRAKPEAHNITSPNVLLPSFVNTSATRASEQDAWTPPAGLDVIQIAGWGVETLKGIKYTDRTKTVCDATLSTCLPQKVIDQRPQTTTDGDKTVISYSADAMGGERYYVNLFQYKKLHINRDHGDILEVPDVLDLILDFLGNNSANPGQFIFTSKPVDPIVENRLSVHSPVSIDVYDSFGNHTGLKPNPDTTSDITLLDEQIPNSQYFEFGEGKYISLPDGEIYNVVIKGTGLGEFDLEFEEGTDGAYSGGPLYSDIPVNPKTVATITIDDNTPVLSLDVDGDGTVDTTIPQGYVLSASSLLDILEYNIKQLALSPRLQRRFDKKITLVRGSITKEQISNANRRLDSLTKDIKSYVSKGYITFEQGEVLMGLIQQIKTAIK